MAAQNKKVKEQNQERIYQLLRDRGELTKQEIAAELGMSMPTTLQNVNEMTERGMIEESGENESTGGRKAKRLQLVKDAGVGVGIEIGVHHVRISLTDFVGEYIGSKSFPLVFEDKSSWYRELSEALSQTLTENAVLEDKVVGVGISFLGIIDLETDMVTRSHVFQIENMSLDRFRNNIPYPLSVYNDANCGGYAEMTPENQNYVYLSLNETVGGSILESGELLVGKHKRTGELGHVVIRPKGKKCYCGKEGCSDAYLSRRNLVEKGDALEDYLKETQIKGETASENWEEYLDNLALLVTNIHMMWDENIILGGEVGSCIEPYMDALKEKAEEYDLFARDIDYLYPCSVRKHICSIGAARLVLKEYGSRILFTDGE